jgi:SOS-response transcriptional repressor LexA
MPLKAAAGEFGEPKTLRDEEWDLDWVEIDTGRRLRKGMFVAQVLGKSMEPMIPDGAYCLFCSQVEGTRQGRTVVVLLRDTTDPETGQRFTVKRYESEKAVSEDGTWRHIKVLLKPVNKDFNPIELTCEDEGSVVVVAEMLEVLR